MCDEKKPYFFILLFGLLLSCVVGVLRGEEPDRWYLISEPELRSIEQYREKSEAERQSWLLQAGELRTQAEKLSARATTLQAESVTLNNHLSAAREAQRKSEHLYEQSEAERLTQLSLKNGEIAILNQYLSDQKIETEKYKGKSLARLIIIVALGVSIVGYIAIKILRFLRVIPI
jgi:hypothetical protein